MGDIFFRKYSAFFPDVFRPGWPRVGVICENIVYTPSPRRVYEPRWCSVYPRILLAFFFVFFFFVPRRMGKNKA